VLLSILGLGLVPLLVRGKQGRLLARAWVDD